MNPAPRHSLASRTTPPCFLFAALALSPGLALAQSTPATAEPAVELSPFIVDTSKNVGYDAANTLSGSRLSTPSKYVGAAIAEITSALMADLALTNVQDLIDYAPNS
jgi:hypothetical protein